MAMNWITDRIAIGSRIDAQDAGLRARAGFRSVICLDGSMTDERALELGYDDCFCATWIDGPGNRIDASRLALDMLIDFVAQVPPVLVHCQAGRSRSVTLVAAYLARTHRITVHDAYRYIAERHETAVTPGLEAVARALA